MAGWKEVLFKGCAIGDLDLVAAAQGDLLVGDGTPVFVALTTGTAGQVLTSGGAAAALTWENAGTGDFKADGSVAMTNALQLKSNAGEAGMDTNDGAIFYDTTADKVKVYVA